MLQTVATNYTKAAEAAVQDYLKTAAETVQTSQFGHVLVANTERIQGGLVLYGYELEGGKDIAMIQRASIALELLHTYVDCMNHGIATSEALRAAHEAEIILANLDVNPEYRLKALSITNRTMMLAAMARSPKVLQKDITYWQATELVLNPLHVGQVLAGANCDRTNAVTDVALAYGEALLDGKADPLDELLGKLRTLV